MVPAPQENLPVPPRWAPQNCWNMGENRDGEGWDLPSSSEDGRCTTLLLQITLSMPLLRAALAMSVTSSDVKFGLRRTLDLRVAASDADARFRANTE